MKLVIDMNMSPALARALRDSGIDAVHWASVGRADAPDATIAAYAAKTGATILTHDLDFGELAVTSSEPAFSVILIRADDLTVAKLLDALLDVLPTLAEHLETKALVTFDPENDRLRILPLPRQ